MAIAKMEPLPGSDLGQKIVPWQIRHADGKDLRRPVSRESHGVGQKGLQASNDPMLGYTEMNGKHYYVRQMKNLKASIPVEWLTGASFNFYAWACGALLARAHARVGDMARIAGYCGNSTALDKALAEWAESYGDQTCSTCTGGI
jgi:hypothetical protein